jgi:hypothetical protein
MSREAGNLTGRHSFKFSGLADRRTVDIQEATGKRGGYASLLLFISVCLCFYFF